MNETRTKLGLAKDLLKSFKMKNSKWREKLEMMPVKSSSIKSAFEFLSIPGKPSVEEICEVDKQLFGWIKEDRKLANRLKIEAIYSRAVQDQQLEISQLELDQSMELPQDLDYNNKSLGLSFEEREKLLRVQPQNIAAGKL